MIEVWCWVQNSSSLTFHTDEKTELGEEQGDGTAYVLRGTRVKWNEAGRSPKGGLQGLRSLLHIPGTAGSWSLLADRWLTEALSAYVQLHSEQMSQVSIISSLRVSERRLLPPGRKSDLWKTVIRLSSWWIWIRNDSCYHKSYFIFDCCLFK